MIFCKFNINKKTINGIIQYIYPCDINTITECEILNNICLIQTNSLTIESWAEIITQEEYNNYKQQHETAILQQVIQPTFINISIDKTRIKADNIDIINIVAELIGGQNFEIYDGMNFEINLVTSTETITNLSAIKQFSTSVPGVYYIKAKFGDLESEELIVEAVV